MKNKNLVISAELRNCMVDNYFEIKKKARLKQNTNKNTLGFSAYLRWRCEDLLHHWQRVSLGLSL